VSDDIFISSDIKTSSNIPDGGIRKGRGKRGHKRRSKLIRNETSSQAYSVRELGELLGKAKRTIQDYAKKGRIPARRIGKSWCFPKEEIDRWFSERKDGHLETSREKDEEEPPEFQKSDFLHANQGESEKGV
jgi:excisionase family DNA binding protein